MSSILSALRYTGVDQAEKWQKRGMAPYYPSDELKEAVDLAIHLRRPLLLKGEPGSGKTRLPEAVACELGLPYQAWYIQSTSRARDGLYTFDTVARLRDAQLTKVGVEAGKDVHEAKNYRTFGPLGQAIKDNKRTVLLIDEIDKADIDFPNDLLRVLDELAFTIPETGEEIKAEPQNAPIIFITSNSERTLPAAFLRRCLFHYVEFPNPERLIKIVKGHFPDPPSELLEQAITRFTQLRQDMQARKRESEKKVSTSELLDWVNVLHHFGNDEVLQQLKEDGLPYAAVLLKSWPDHKDYLLSKKEATAEQPFLDELDDEMLQKWQ